MSHKSPLGYSISLLFFLLFWSITGYGQPSVCDAYPNYPICSGDGSPSVEIITPEKLYTNTMDDVELSFSINRCDSPCMGNNGNAPPPPNGNSLRVTEIIDNKTNTSIKDVPITNLPSTNYTVGSNGVYIVNWSHGLPPGSYTVTTTVCVCFEDALGNATSCCTNKTHTFTLYVLEPVPTMTQWGLFLFALVVLNLGLVFVYHQRHQLEY